MNRLINLNYLIGLTVLTAIKPYRPLSLDYTCPVGFEYPKYFKNRSKGYSKASK